MSTPVRQTVDPAGSSDAAQSQPGSADDMSNGRWIAIFAMVVVILGGFAVLMLYMLRTSGDTTVTENVWGRRLYVYGSAEAITFTAVGWLFGREVHRTAAKVARKQAADASADAKDAHRATLAKTDEAARAQATGELVARAVVASANNAGSASETSDTARYTALGRSNAQLDSLKELVTGVYPELS